MVYDTEYYNKDGDLVPNGQVAIKDSAIGRGLHRKDFMQSIKGRRDSNLRAELEKVGFDFSELSDYHRVGKVNFEHTAADPDDNKHPDNSHVYFNTPKPGKNEFFGNLTGNDVFVNRDNRKEGNMFDMYDVAQLRMKREDPNIGVVANPNQLSDGAVAWKGDVSYANRRGDIGDLGDYVNTDHHDDADVPYDNEYFRTGFPMNIAFQILKGKSYIQDRPKRLAQAKVQRLSRKVKNARTQHKYKRNLARGAIRPKMRTQTGLVRVARSR